jgi:NAD(P)-dependent dehydrogenase (short-subunit alcohol dehydrogenase family)
MAGLVEGKVALVTGAGSGIGRESARLFAAEGAAVLVTDVDETGGTETVDLITGAGGEASFLRVDVSSEADVENMVAAALERFGGLHCAHNNAGISDPPVDFTDMTLESWNRMIAIQLTGTFLCMKHELRHLLVAGGGAICNTASGASFVPAPGQVHYTSAKHGVLGLTRQGASDYARRGVRVNAVCPGIVDTPMMRAFMASDPAMAELLPTLPPPGRMATAREIAECAVWLCSDRSSYVSGVSMPVDYGQLLR